MAEYISFQPSDYFNTLLWTGNSPSTQALTGVGFQPDVVWVKKRSSAAAHCLTDSVRGVTETLFPNDNDAETTRTGGLTVFGSDGYTVGADGDFNGGSATFVGWSWKAGTTSGIATNGSTTITPSSYSFSQTSGMSIITYTGNSTNDGQKVPHGLGTAPSFIIIKNVESSGQWTCYHKSLGNTKALSLDTTASAETDAGTGGYNFWYRTDPDSVNFTIGSSNYTNPSDNMVAYCFAEKKGYSKFGTYTGNGNADGNFIYTGFKPALFIIKRTNAAADWEMYDNKRDGFNDDNPPLYANTTGAEGSNDRIDILSNGFKIRASSGNLGADGGTYIYLAFAEFPLVSSNDVPGVAR